MALFAPGNAGAAGAGDGFVYEAAVAMGVGTSDGLFPAVVALLAQAEVRPQALGGVVCGSGPGSFTSLRIAAALAKGLAHGSGCPLYQVHSLALAAASLHGDAPAGRYVVHADALRGERYVLEVERHADGAVTPLGETSRRSIDELAATTDEAFRIAIGAVPGLLPSAYVVLPRASAVWRVRGTGLSGPVDLARWEPAYGRLAEAQVQWETSHGRSLDASASA